MHGLRKEGEGMSYDDGAGERAEVYLDGLVGVAKAYNAAEAECRRIYAENAELRELVRVVVYCMQYERECDGCRLNGADGTITAPVGCDGLFDRMRELGVEV